MIATGVTLVLGVGALGRLVVDVDYSGYVATALGLGDVRLRFA